MITTGANSMALANVLVAFAEAEAKAALVGVGSAFCTSEKIKITINIIIPMIPAANTDPPDCFAFNDVFVYDFFSSSNIDIYKFITPS